MMAAQLTVKAYLKRWNVQLGRQEEMDEIRRFSVDYDVSTNFEYLMAKITNVFPGLVNKSITLYWKDPDNDMIAFSSDDELMEALKSISDGMFRVFIIEKASAATSVPPQQQASSADLLHLGITCDGCEGPVCGIRYKCTVCPDYDLCSRCKATGLHSEHDMRTISTPILPWPHCGQMAEGAFPGPCGLQMPPPPHPPSCFAPPPPPYPDNGFCNPAEMRKMHRRAWKRWYRETYGAEDHKRKHKKEKKEKKKQEEKKTEKKEEKDSGAAHKSSDSSSSDSEGDTSPATEYLKNVGSSVAAMLDPLGIDVEVDVESRGQRRRCRRGMGMRGGWGWPGMRGGVTGPAAAGGPCGGPWGMRGRWWGGHGMHGGGGHFGPWGNMRARWGGCCPMRPAPNQQPSGPDAASQPIRPDAPQPSEPNAEQPSGPQNATRRDLDTNSETGEMASGQFFVPDQDWTMVNGAAPLADVEEATTGVEQLHMSTAEAAVSFSSIPMAPLYPSLPADPKIAEAVEQMMAMGYNNEGGWLTQLLVAHNGDIGRALDAIHAKK
jgi:sequestosome 1